MTNEGIVRVLVAAFVACTTMASIISPAAIPVVHGNSAILPSPVSRSRDSSIAFEENRGQYDPRVLFAGKGNGQTVFLTADEATFVLPMPAPRSSSGPASKVRSDENREAAEKREVYALKMEFVGANLAAETTFAGELPGRMNYFRGNDPSRWATDVPRFGRVTSSSIYPGIDLTWYGNDAGAMEYDLVVGPGADPDQISLQFDGADRVSVDDTGNLAIETPAGTLRHTKPVIYQDIDGRRRSVDGSYTVSGSHVGFSLRDYDRSRSLVIDPILPPIYYSTYLGGTGGDIPKAIKVNGSNNAYVAGQTNSVDFPITSGINPAYTDAFVTKLDANGTALVYSTLIGGGQDDFAFSLAIDGSGNAYITGNTVSSDFPTSWITYDSTYNGAGDAFVTKLGPNGSSMPYSTFVGGSATDVANGIAVDTGGSAYLAGTTFSTNFPTTIRAYDKFLTGSSDAFVTKLSPSGNGLAYSTYLGGVGFDESGLGIAVDSTGNAFVTGTAHAGQFPVTAGSFSSVHNAAFPDFYVTKLNATLSGLVYSTVIGGDEFDESAAIAIDSSGNAYVTGYTYSFNYPVTAGAYETVLAPSTQAAFVTKVNPAGSALDYSSYLAAGGGGNTLGQAIAVNSVGAIFVTGNTTGDPLFPTIPVAWDYTLNGGFDVFLTKLPGVAFTPLSASTLIGGAQGEVPHGLAINSAGDAFITGQTSSVDFPTTLWTAAYDTTYNGSTDGFVLRYDKAYLP